MTIRKSIRVERPPEISFRVFVEAIGKWWPKGPSFNGKLLTDMIIEGRVGGRFFERYADGTEYEIGRITAYQPPTGRARAQRLGASRKPPRNQQELRSGMGFHSGPVSIARRFGCVNFEQRHPEEP